MKRKKKLLRADLLPIIFTLALLPLVAKGQEVEISLDNYSWFPDGVFQYDFFMYWKEIIFLILAGWMLVMLTDRWLIRRIPFRSLKMCMPLALYGGLTVLSTILSVDKTLSLKGMWQQYESLWVLLGYLVAVFYCMQVVESINDVKILLTALAVGALLQGILGITQMSGHDFFSSEAGKSLLTAGFDSSVKEALRFNFAGDFSVYMALYTPNYAGVYVVMIFPVLLALAAIIRNKIQKILLLVLSGILMICLWGSGSRTGFIVLGVLILVAVCIFPDKNQNKSDRKKRWICAGVAVIAAQVLIFGYDFANDHAISGAFGAIFQKESYDLEAMEADREGLTLEYKGKSLKVIPEMTEWGMTLTAKESNGDKKTASWNSEKQCFDFKGTDYEDLEFDAYEQEDTQYLILKYADISWNFYKEMGSDHFVYINQYGKDDTIKTVQAVLKGHEKALSGRGYIWGRTIPLLLKHFLWGSGPDTFVVEFPQTDYVMKANTGLGMYQQLPTKAHSMYLQSALQTGVLSLICLLVFWGRYVICFIKNVRQRENSESRWLSLGIFLGVTGFLLMGIMNDSNLAVSPVFWCMLGTGIAMETFHG